MPPMSLPTSSPRPEDLAGGVIHKGSASVPAVCRQKAPTSDGVGGRNPRQSSATVPRARPRPKPGKQPACRLAAPPGRGWRSWAHGTTGKSAGTGALTSRSTPAYWRGDCVTRSVSQAARLVVPCTRPATAATRRSAIPPSRPPASAAARTATLPDCMRNGLGSALRFRG